MNKSLLLVEMFEPDPPHSYTLTFDERDGYLYAYVEGEHDNYEISRAFWSEIAERASSINAERILIDENIRDTISMVDVFRLALEMAQMGFDQTQIAFVDRYLDQNEINEFGQLVAVNRGVNCKVFNDAKAAKEWLMSKG